MWLVESWEQGWHLGGEVRVDAVVAHGSCMRVTARALAEETPGQDDAPVVAEGSVTINAAPGPVGPLRWEAARGALQMTT